MDHLLSHPASTLLVLVILALAIRLTVRFVRGPTPERNGGLGGAFLAGILIVNALAHFTHGISGEHFPGPFGYQLASGFLSNLSNVIWGFINIALGYVQLRRSKPFEDDVRRTAAFFIGVLAMGVFLASVFSK